MRFSGDEKIWITVFDLGGKAMHWSEKIAKDIIKRSPDKEEYVCAAGISPSGSIHIGNFRDIATSYFVYKALLKLKTNSRKKMRRNNYMIKKEKLIKKLKRKISSEERQLKHKNLYNLRNYIIKGLLKTGIALDYAFPFIVSSFIIFNAEKDKGNIPFINNQVTETAYVKETITSTGIEKENISYDDEFDERSFQYSTSWKINDNGQYERKVTTYKIDDSIDLSEYETLFAMTKEEIDNSFTISSIKTIRKDQLEEEDNIYNKDMFIIVQSYPDEDNKRTKMETTKENISGTLKYLLLLALYGNISTGIKEILIRSNIRNQIKKIEPYFTVINSNNIEKVTNVYNIRKENLHLLTNNYALGKEKKNLIETTKNDEFHKFNSLDLQELVTEIENYYLLYRNKLNLPDFVTFGVEIEYEKLLKTFVDNYVDKNLESWDSKHDLSIKLGGEIASPILHNDLESWQELREICNYLKKRKADTEINTGGHIHVGAHILGDNIKDWEIFIKTYTTYEHVLFRFLYGDKINARKSLNEYAPPTADLLYNKIEKLDNYKRITELTGLELGNRFKALNLNNAYLYNIYTQERKNTIEFRSGNSTTDAIIWQNNINTVCNLMLAPSRDRIDKDFIDYKLKHRIVNSNEDYYLYNEIHLQDALEFADMIFDNNLDKIYFLRQYFKSFEDNYGIKGTVKAKKFTK